MFSKKTDPVCDPIRLQNECENEERSACHERLRKAWEKEDWDYQESCDETSRWKWKCEQKMQQQVPKPPDPCEVIKNTPSKRYCAVSSKWVKDKHKRDKQELVYNSRDLTSIELESLKMITTEIEKRRALIQLYKDKGVDAIFEVTKFANGSINRLGKRFSDALSFYDPSLIVLAQTPEVICYTNIVKRFDNVGPHAEGDPIVGYTRLMFSAATKYYNQVLAVIYEAQSGNTFAIRQNAIKTLRNPEYYKKSKNVYDNYNFGYGPLESPKNFDRFSFKSLKDYQYVQWVMEEQYRETYLMTLEYTSLCAYVIDQVSHVSPPRFTQTLALETWMKLKMLKQIFDPNNNIFRTTKMQSRELERIADTTIAIGGIARVEETTPSSVYNHLLKEDKHKKTIQFEGGHRIEVHGIEIPENIWTTIQVLHFGNN